jgi:hypothetical protein
MELGNYEWNIREYKSTPVPLCPPQIPHDLASNPGRHGEEPATNCLSYGTALHAV